MPCPPKVSPPYHPTFKLEDAESIDIILVVLGCARAGKSTFINHLLKDVKDSRTPLKVDPDCLGTVTSDIEAELFDSQMEGLRLPFSQLHEEQGIVLVDTPGIPDSEWEKQKAVLRYIAARLREPLTRATLGGVIYVHDISQDRGDGETAYRLLATFSSLCPQATIDRTVFLTSKWRLDDSTRDFPRKERQLRQGKWGSKIREAHFMRLRPDDELGGPHTSWQVIRHALWRLDIDLCQNWLGELDRFRGELKKNRKAIPDEVETLRKTLQEGSKLQKEVLGLLKATAEGNSGAEAGIAEKGETLRALRHMMVQKIPRLYNAGLTPSTKRKLFAFNALVIE